MSAKYSAGAVPEPNWIKSSHSSNGGPDCVEVAATRDAVPVLDAKDTGLPSPGVAPAAWTDFLSCAGTERNTAS